jgi:endonuclease-3
MDFKALPLPELLDRLEAFHGSQAPCWPVDPYEFLVWWHCGYPASDERCARGWQALKSQIGIQPAKLLAASQAKLAVALKAGGMVPEIRALRLQQIAQRVVQELDGDLSSLFTGRISAVRTALKRFPGISDPGADRILLFAGVVPIAAVPSNCPHVPVRMIHGLEHENYSATYREAQGLIEDEVPEQIHARQRAYLLLKVHGQTICKSKPRCDECPVSASCAYERGRLPQGGNLQRRAAGTDSTQK